MSSLALLLAVWCRCAELPSHIFFVAPHWQKIAMDGWDGLLGILCGHGCLLLVLCLHWLVSVYRFVVKKPFCITLAGIRLLHWIARHDNPLKKRFSLEQCFFSSRKIGLVTSKIVYSYYLKKKYFLDQSIQKIFHLILKTEALELPAVVSNTRRYNRTSWQGLQTCKLRAPSSKVVTMPLSTRTTPTFPTFLCTVCNV